MTFIRVDFMVVKVRITLLLWFLRNGLEWSVLKVWSVQVMSSYREGSCREGPNSIIISTTYLIEHSTKDHSA